MQRFFFPIDLHLREIESSIGHDIGPDPYFTADCKVLYLIHTTYFSYRVSFILPITLALLLPGPFFFQSKRNPISKSKFSILP